MLMLALFLAVAVPASDDGKTREDFDRLPSGALPDAWRSGGGQWEIQGDSVPAHKQVLKMSRSGKGPFNLCFLPASAFQDGELSVDLKAISGDEDQGGGPIWRVQDADNYWLCRVNPLEDNFRLYTVIKGQRHQLDSATVKVKPGEWHRITVRHQGARVTCLLDGKELLHAQEDALPAAGGVGLWSKSDAVTCFDDLSISPASKALPILVRRIPLPGVEGRLDHLALDLKSRRLYVAALGNGSVEAVDLEPGRVSASAKGLQEPQGLAFLAESQQLAVTCGGDGALRFLDAATLQERRAVSLGDDADNVRLAGDGKTLFAGCRSGALTQVEVSTAGIKSEYALPGHPEGISLDPAAQRAYVNLPGHGVAAIDLAGKAKTEIWRLDAAANYPLALDAGQHRLYLGCRKPACLVVLDTRNGRQLAKIPCVADADDLFIDDQLHRLYVIGGGGALEIFVLHDGDAPQRLASLPLPEGARTGLWDPSGRRLFVAVPHRGEQAAEIRIYDLTPNPAKEIRP